MTGTLLLWSAAHLQPNGRNLVLVLAFQKMNIDSIKDVNPKDNSGCLDDAMDHWIKQNYDTEKFGLPSWRTLVAAVAQVNKRLCKQLAIKYQGNGGTSRI